MGARAEKTRLFGDLLRALRDAALKKGSSLRRAGTAADRQMSHTAIRNYEKKQRVPGILAIEAMAQAYKIDWESLSSALLEDLKNDHATLDRLLAIARRPRERRAQAALRINDKSSVRVDLLEDPIAAGRPLEIRDSAIAGTIPFDASWLHKLGVSKPYCVRVENDNLSMSPTVKPGHIVLLDCADWRRSEPVEDRIYAVSVPGEGATLKRVIFGQRGLLLVSDNPDKDAYPTKPLELEDDESVSNAIIGLRMWSGERPLL